MALTEFNSLSVTVSPGQQSVTWLELLQFGKHKLRVTIKSDSYKFQCMARIEVLDADPVKWNILAYRPHGVMQTEEAMRWVLGRVYQKEFSADRQWLLDQARLLLG